MNVTAVCVGVALIVYGGFVWLKGGGAWQSKASLIVAVTMIPIFTHEFLRRWYVQSGRPEKLVGVALGYGIATVPVALVVSERGDAQLVGIVVGVALTAMLAIPSVRVLRCQQRLATSRTGGAIPTIVFSKARWNVLSHVAYAGYTTGIQFMLAGLGSLTAQAVFSATRNLVQPLNVLMVALDTIDKPIAGKAYRQHGWSGLWDVMRKMLLTLVLVGGGYLIVVLLLGEQAIRWLYDGKYDGASRELLLWAACYVVMMLTMPLETAKYVLNSTESLFVNRLVALFVGLGVAAALIPTSGAVGALYAWLGAWSAGGLMSAYQLELAARKHRGAQ